MWQTPVLPTLINTRSTCAGPPTKPRPAVAVRRSHFSVVVQLIEDANADADAGAQPQRLSDCRNLGNKNKHNAQCDPLFDKCVESERMEFWT